MKTGVSVLRAGSVSDGIAFPSLTLPARKTSHVILIWLWVTLRDGAASDEHAWRFRAVGYFCGIISLGRRYLCDGCDPPWPTDGRSCGRIDGLCPSVVPCAGGCRSGSLPEVGSPADHAGACIAVAVSRGPQPRDQRLALRATATP